MSASSKQREESSLTVVPGTDLDTFRGLVEDAGTGVEALRAEDLSLPFVLIMEKGSPYIDRVREQYVSGGDQGDFFSKLTKTFYNGEKGLDIVMCAARCDYNEWSPRKDDKGNPLPVVGVGFHGTHSRDEPEVRRLINEQWPDGKVFGPVKMPNGHHLIQTWTVYALWAPKPITENNAMRGVFPFTSTRIKAFTETAAAIRAFTYPIIDEHGRPDSVNPASYAHKWHISTRTKSAGGNSWYIPYFELTNGPNWVDSLIRPNERLYRMAKDFRALVESGTVRADYATTDVSDGGDAPSRVVDDEVPF